MLEAKELREKTGRELQELLAKGRKDLLEVRLQLLGGAVKDKSLARKKRKEIARILTVLNEKKRGGKG